jgi:ornithine carbamoyltransferase
MKEAGCQTDAVAGNQLRQNQVNEALMSRAKPDAILLHCLSG